MGKRRRSFVCRECGAQHASWTGRCPSCRAWATVEEVAHVSAERRSVTNSGAGPMPLATYSADAALPSPTGVDEVDRVLGGGLTPGSVTLLGGEPGCRQVHADPPGGHGCLGPGRHHPSCGR